MPRPAKPQAERLDTRLTIRLTSDTLTRWKDAAREADLKVAEWLRDPRKYSCGIRNLSQANFEAPVKALQTIGSTTRMRPRSRRMRLAELERTFMQGRWSRIRHTHA